MFKTKFKKELVTKPDTKDTTRSKNLAEPATQISDKLAPAKFLKNLNDAVTKVSPPTVVNASESKAKKSIYNKTFDFSQYKKEIQNGTDNVTSLGTVQENIELIPDIISLLEFKPAYIKSAEDKVESTSVNDLLNIQISLRQLSENIINRILNKLYDDLDLSDVINERRQTFTKNISNADATLSLYTELHNKIKDYQNIIDFKNYKTSFKNGATYLNTDYFTVSEHFKQEYGYSDLAIKSFTNTKMILQFLEELYNSAKFYSYNSLISDKKIDRKADRNHFSITQEEKIDISPIINAESPDASYQSLQLLLPKNIHDSIFLSALFLGKEYSASTAVSNQLFLGLLDIAGIEYAGATDDLFLKIIGRPNTDILLTNSDDNSVVSGVKYTDTGDIPVLPFENKWFTNQNSSKAVFIPGDRFVFEPLMIPESSIAERTERLRDIASSLSFSPHSSLLRMSLAGFNINQATLNDATSVVEVNGKSVLKNKRFDEISIFDEIIKILGYVSLVDVSKLTTPTKWYQGSLDEYVIGFLNAAKKDLSLKVKLEKLLRPAHRPAIGYDNFLIRTSFNQNQDQKTLFNNIIDHVKNTSKINVSKLTFENDKQILQDMFFNDSGIYGLKNSIIARLYQAYEHILAVFFLTKGLSSDGGLTGSSITTTFRGATRDNIWSLVYEVFFNVVTTVFSGINLEVNPAEGKGQPTPTKNLLRTIVINSYDGKAIKKTGETFINTIVNPILNSQQRGTMTLGTDRILYDGVLKIRSVRNTLVNNKISTIKSIQLLDFFEQYRSYLNGIQNFISNTSNLQFIRDTKQLILENVDNQTDTNIDFTYFNQQQVAVSFKRFMDFTGLINGTVVVPPPPPPPGDFADKAKPYIIASYSATAPPIYKSDIGSKEYIELFRSWLNTDLAIRSNSKILSVGIPYSMSDNLKEKVELDDDTNLTGPWKDVGIGKSELDIIKVTVYKEDLEYEDIIFKPKEYIFELSRFVNRDTINNKTSLAKKIKENKTNLAPTLMELKDTVLTSDYLAGFNPMFTTYENEFSDELTQQLGSKTINELKKNHINSDMLMLYIKLLTGADLQEVNFPAVDNIVYPAQDQELIQLFNLLGDEEDLQTWAQLFTTKTILTNGVRESLELLVPKKYERIFNVAISEDDFPIDQKLTEKSLLESLKQQDLVAEKTIESDKGLYLNKKKLENISLERFYVKISTLSDIGIG